MDSAFKVPVPRKHSNSYEVSLVRQEFTVINSPQFTKKELPRLLVSDQLHVDKAFRHPSLPSPATGRREESGIPGEMLQVKSESSGQWFLVLGRYQIGQHMTS